MLKRSGTLDNSFGKTFVAVEYKMPKRYTAIETMLRHRVKENTRDLVLTAAARHSEETDYCNWRRYIVTEWMNKSQRWL